MVAATTHVATAIVARIRDRGGIVAITGTTVSARTIATPVVVAAVVVAAAVVATAAVTPVEVVTVAVAAVKAALVTAIAIGIGIRTGGRGSVQLRAPVTMAVAMSATRKPTARSPSARRKWQTAPVSPWRPWLRLQRRVG
jgi:hypothetical protein